MLVHSQKLSALILLNLVPRSGVAPGPYNARTFSETIQIPTSTCNNDANDAVNWNGLNCEPIFHKCPSSRHDSSEVNVYPAETNEVVVVKDWFSECIGFVVMSSTRPGIPGDPADLNVFNLRAVLTTGRSTDKNYKGT